MKLTQLTQSAPVVHSVKMIGLIVVLVLCVSNLNAQYTENPLKDKRWFGISGGLNTADNISWNASAFYAKRSDVILTETRVAFSQELVEGANDSCFSRKNKIAEYALMWGDGWGGERWYLSLTAGFGFNVRWYCDIRSKGEVPLTAVTIGIPVQLEFGAMFSKRMGAVLVGTGNWNLRQSYLGLNIGMVWRLNKAKE